MSFPPLPPPITAEAFCRKPFDYLIVGGGTAGLVVATRLSENPDVNVGVLEAGSAAFDEPLINIPGRFGEALGSEYDWKFETISQAGLAGRRLPWPRGKVLGGTSALNFMTWNRGCREDYDAWKALGNEGWGWDGLLPFFKKSECFCDPSPSHQKQHSSYFNPENLGRDGPIHAVYSAEYSAAHQHWHSTLNKLGVQTNRNHFGGSNVGVWTSLTSVDPKNRARCYSATGYYLPVASRPNLTILTTAVVEEITIEQADGKWVATGARFSHGGQSFRTKAEEEVIVCAGSVQSPQLLELSGVGSPDVLKRAGINVKVANPRVGENLQEHIMTAAVYEILPDIITPDDLRSSPDLMASAIQDYTQNASGPLAAIPSSICYLPLDQVMAPSSLQRISSLIPSSPNPSDPQSVLRHEIQAKQFRAGSRLGQVEYNFDTSNYSPFFESKPGKKYATMLQMLQYPFSVGSIHIGPSETPNGRATVHDKPLIDPRYYKGEGGAVDFEIMVAAQAFGHKITSTQPLSSIIVKRVFPPLPPSLEGDEVFSDYVRNHTITDWHPVGTCSMGPEIKDHGVDKGQRERWGGVVDDRLRVHGVQRLRVVDASIMPLHVSAHIQATVYAIGEKGASIVLEDHENRKRGEATDIESMRSSSLLA